MAREKKPLRVLLLGANGQIGYELRRSLRPLGLLDSPSRADVDFNDPEGLRGVVRNLAPNIVVNAAAYTAVDKAEEEPELAMTINARAPGILAEEAEEVGACLVHYSTDYVFDGCSAQPYVEDARVNPLSEYGRSKLAGEQAVVKSCRRHLIFRTSWVFGQHGANFLKTILGLAAERTSLDVVTNQVGTPTSARFIADVTRHVLSIMEPVSATDGRWGIYHLTAGGAVNWHAYARYIVEQALKQGIELKLSAVDVNPVTTDEQPSLASRPSFSTLDTNKIKSGFDIKLPDWKSGVDSVLNALARQQL